MKAKALRSATAAAVTSQPSFSSSSCGQAPPRKKPMASFCSPPFSLRSHASLPSSLPTSSPGSFPSLTFLPRLSQHPNLFRAEMTHAGSLIEPAAIAQEDTERDIFNSIARLYVERKAMEEHVERNEEEGSKAGRDTADYCKRAYLYGCSADMVITGKKNEERLLQELELVQGDVMERDSGKSSEDYLRRAQLFSTCAEIFTKRLV